MSDLTNLTASLADLYKGKDAAYVDGHIRGIGFVSTAISTWGSRNCKEGSTDAELAKAVLILPVAAAVIDLYKAAQAAKEKNAS